ITDKVPYDAHPAGPAPSWHVAPGRPGADVSVDVGNAGTVMRFAPPVAALTTVSVGFRGDARAAQRPVGPILAALRELGAVIDDGGRAAIPFTVRGTGSLPGGAVTLDASASSQLVSGLLLTAPRFDKGVEIRHRGARAPSAPHIAMTVAMLRDAGAEVETATHGPGTPAGPPDTWRVHPGVIGHHEVIVQPDLSSAVPFLAAALVTGGTVMIAGWPAVTSQPAAQILDLLSAFGASCTLVKGEGEAGGGGGGRAGGGDGREPGGPRGPGRRRRVGPGGGRPGRARGRPVAADRHRAPAPPRDRPAGGAGHRDRRARRGRHRAGRRPGDQTAAAAGRRPAVRQLRRPPHGDGRRRAGPRGPGDRGGGRGHRGPDGSRPHPAVGVDAGTSALTSG